MRVEREDKEEGVLLICFFGNVFAILFLTWNMQIFTKAYILKRKY